MHSFHNMENNINMNYKNLIVVGILLFLVIFIVVILVFLTLKLGFNIILSSEIHNKKIEIKLSFKCFFDLININKIIYPISKTDEIESIEKKSKTKNKNKEGRKNKFNLKLIEVKDLVKLLRIIKKINIVEIYSSLDFGFEEIEITSFVYFLVNVIYGNVYSCFEPKKMYLNVKPCYTSTHIDYTSRIHIRPTIKDILSLMIALIKIYKKISIHSKVKNKEEEDIDEISKLHKEFDGYNSGVN